MYSLRIRTWLLRRGQFLLSEGRATLLRYIDSERSLLKAAERMGMSYRHAWGTVKKIEKVVNRRIVRSVRGGNAGGMTTLTKAGREILDEYTTRTERVARFLENGDIRLAADGIIVLEDRLVLVQRAYPPYKGRLALPGGFVEPGERTDEAAVREALEETGLRTVARRLVGVYSSPDRDPRGHVVSTVYELEAVGGRLKRSRESRKIKLVPLRKLPKLAFDHFQIMEDYIATLS